MTILGRAGFRGGGHGKVICKTILFLSLKSGAISV